MHKSGKPIGFWSAVALGMGAMIGAGIFALLGEAGSIASSAVYLSFILGGIIALLSGYSMARLGARFPAAGGIVEYVVQAFGINVFSGAVSILFYIVGVVGMSLVAKAFGTYGAAFITEGEATSTANLLGVSILAVLGLVNFMGAGQVAKLENTIVLIKVSVLVVFGLVGLYYLQPHLLAPASYPPTNRIFSAIAITFFAYTGFGVITNAAEDMPDPEKTLPRAMLAAVLIVMVIYTTIAIAVFGNLPVEQVVAAKDYALAAAAEPVFGQVGFTVVAIAALVSTASAINANLYSVTNITYQLAKDGELPREFGKPLGHSREGLLISLIITAILVLFFDLGQIAAAGSLSVLLVYSVMHLGHLKLLRQTGASPFLIWSALATTLAAFILGIGYAVGETQGVGWMIGGFVLSALLIEILLRAWKDRTVRHRLPRKD